MFRVDIHTSVRPDPLLELTLVEVERYMLYNIVNYNIALWIP